VHKDSITSIHIVLDEEAKMQKIITTSLDGFIKMIDSRDGLTKKGFFVNQSGINSATPLSSQDSFAVRLIVFNLFIACRLKS
jgi:hypothetical protein